ncbi:MAG: bile acid:sodium symporter family protein [Myxococcales bacterium]|nr:MAG: bile acid:sodium symporter family protein [Myxococcales bacterium]
MSAALGLFPVWALLLSGLAYLAPQFFTPLAPAIVPLLGIVMFGMGTTLEPAAFRSVLERPRDLAVGTTLQFGLMPLIAWLVTHGFGLDPELAAGLILVGACPGGTASNVICYFARADVALSIALTTVSTLLAALATPLLTELYAGRIVEVQTTAMIVSIVKIVLVPVALGVAVDRLARQRLDPLRRLFPLLSTGAIVLIIAIIVAAGRDRLAELSAAVVLAVALHNGASLAAGYWIARGLGMDRARCRTLAIEVGTQNSGLGVALAVKYFGTLAALPGAVYSVWHNLTGAALASLWARGEIGSVE